MTRIETAFADFGMNPESLLIFRLSAMGDVCMMAAVLRGLQKRMPDVQLEWMISNPAYQLVNGMEGIQFHVIDKPRGLGDLYRFQRRFSNSRWDVLLAAQSTPRSNLMYPLLKAERKIGYDVRRGRLLHGLGIGERIEFREEHILDGFLSLVHRLTGEGGVEPDFGLPVFEQDRVKADELLGELGAGDYFSVNPCSSKPERDWPEERFIRVIREVQKRYGLACVITGGPSSVEKTRCREMAEKTRSLDLSGRTGPKTLAEVLRRGRFLISVDSGPVHIARSMDCPVVGLYAVAPPRLTGPWRQTQYCVDKYGEAMRLCFGSAADSSPPYTRAHHPDAMKLIECDEVLPMIESLAKDLELG